MGIIVIDPPPPPPPPPKAQRMAGEDWAEVWEYCFNIAQTYIQGQLITSRDEAP